MVHAISKKASEILCYFIFYDLIFYSTTTTTTTNNNVYIISL